MLELSGIPWQDDEKATHLVNKTAVVARICNFDVSQIDIAYRVSQSICNFYRQKNKLLSLSQPYCETIMTIIIIV